MKRKINFAIIGSNFGIRGYLPVIEKFSKFKIVFICSRKIKKHYFDKKIKANFISDWRKVFTKKIDIIISAVPPKVQEKILLYNLRHKKKIILEKPITSNYLKSKKILSEIKKKNIYADINLTFVNHPYFRIIKKIIESKKYGNVKNYFVEWSFVSHDYNLKKKTWKVEGKHGGGITNIFLTHVLSYCEYLFGKNTLKNSIIKKRQV